MIKSELLSVGEGAGFVARLESIAQSIRTGELGVANADFEHALAAVQDCTRYMRPDKSVPDCSAYRTRNLRMALGYPADEPNEVLLHSVEDFTPGLEYTEGYTDQPRLVYAPEARSFDTATHIAGITAMIADSPAAHLLVHDRAVLIANVVSGFSHGLYAPIYGTKLASPAISKGAAIRASRNELIALTKTARDIPSVDFYKDLLREVNHETGYNSRLVAKGLAGLAVGYAFLSRK